MEPDDSPPRPVPILNNLYGTHSTYHNSKYVLNETQTFRTERVINTFTRVTCRPTTNWARRHGCAGHHHDVESSWIVIAHGDAREGKWRGNWQMEWVSSTLHTTSEHGVSSITTADAHTSAASSRLNSRPRRFKWIDEIWFLRVCHHISYAVY